MFVDTLSAADAVDIDWRFPVDVCGGTTTTTTAVVVVVTGAMELSLLGRVVGAEATTTTALSFLSGSVVDCVDTVIVDMVWLLLLFNRSIFAETGLGLGLDLGSM